MKNKTTIFYTKKILTALVLASLVTAAAGCGATTEDAADTNADTAADSVSENDSDTQTSDDSSSDSDDGTINIDGITIDPNATVSPYYNSAGSEDPDSASSDTADASSGDADGISDEINATVYNDADSVSASPSTGSGDTGSSMAGETDAADTDTTSERVDYDVYVATYGLDTNDGTKDYPFATIQKGLDSVTPGHTVYIYSGIYSGGNTFNISGTEEAPITVTAMPESNVIVTLNYGEDGAIFDMNGQDYITVRELQIGYTRSDWVYGFFMNGGENNITITDNDICNLATYNRNGSGYGGAYAVLMYGQGNDEESAISNISVNNNRIYTIETGNCEAVAVSGNADTIAIDSNIIYDIMNIGIDIYGNADYCSNPALDQPRNIDITANSIYNCVSDNYAVGGIYIDGARDVNIKDNVVYENMYGIVVCSEHRDDNYPVTNIVINSNDIHENHDGGIAMGGYDTTLSGLITNSEITENTMYNNGIAANDGWNGEIDIEKVNGITVSNNEITAHDYQYPVISSQVSGDFCKNVTFTNNLYQTGTPANIRFRFAGTTYKGLDNWNSGVGATDISSKSSSK